MKEVPPFFDHERLVVYQRSIEFVAWTTRLLENVPKKLSVANQLDRASTSIPLNIAEGNGKSSSKDRCNYLDIARGSALESAACLDALVAKGVCSADHIYDGKVLLHQIVSLLIGLMKSLSPERFDPEREP